MNTVRGSFYRGPLAKTTEERMLVLGNLPHAGLMVTIKSHAIDANVDWLQSMLEGGVFDLPRNVDDEAPLLIFGESIELVWGGIEIWDAIASLIDSGGVSIPLRVHGLGEHIHAEDEPEDSIAPPARFSAKAGDDLRQFHRDFCAHLVDEAEAYIERSADRQAKPNNEADALQRARTSSEVVRAINLSLGVALATACMLDDPDSVSLIARRFPLAVSTAIHPLVLGENWQTAISGQQQDLFLVDRIGIGVPQPALKLTPFGCALLYSSKNAMRTLRTHSPKSTRVLGYLMTDTEIPEETGVPFGVKDLWHTLNIVFDQDALDLASDYEAR